MYVDSIVMSLNSLEWEFCVYKLCHYDCYVFIFTVRKCDLCRLVYTTFCSFSAVSVLEQATFSSSEIGQALADFGGSLPLPPRDENESQGKTRRFGYIVEVWILRVVWSLEGWHKIAEKSGVVL